MKFNKKIKRIVLAFTVFILAGCGEGVVEIGQNTYQPKIVIEGYLYPGKNVQNIRITRNIPLNSRPGSSSIILSSADVRLTDLQANKEYKLSYNPVKFSYEYNGADLLIGFDKSYKLSVVAEIDGKFLRASSITKTPKEGFRILHNESLLDSLRYREPDAAGGIKSFRATFVPSEGSTFYVISIVALDASKNNFIFDNPYIEVTEKDLADNFDNYKFQLMWLQNVKSSNKKLNYNVEWLHTWFYSRYRLIIYAADENFRLFVQTHRNVQEFDGNFHEPRLNIEGDGIGIFGSAIADTAYFKVIK